MKDIKLTLKNGGDAPIVQANINDPILAAFIITGFVIMVIVLAGLLIIGMRFLCAFGGCNAF